jgi:hypothetical protein
MQILDLNLLSKIVESMLSLLKDTETQKLAADQRAQVLQVYTRVE